MTPKQLHVEIYKIIYPDGDIRYSYIRVKEEYNKIQYSTNKNVAKTIPELMILSNEWNISEYEYYRIQRDSIHHKITTVKKLSLKLIKEDIPEYFI